MRKRVVRVLVLLWIALVFVGATAYIAAHIDTIKSAVSTVTLWRLAVAILFISGGKLLLVHVARASVEAVGASLAYRQMYTVNAMTQLAKYLPGGVWHFAGRAGYYHAAGLTPMQNTKAMVFENVWMASSALFVGVALFGLYSVGLVKGLIVILGVTVLMALVIVVVLRWQHVPLRVTWIGRLLAVEWGAWLSIGLSFWVLLPLEAHHGMFFLAVSTFPLSWFVGYVTIFAPSGIGIREVMVAAVLSIVIGPQTTLVYATIHRLLWVITEILLATIAQLFYRASFDNRTV